MTAHDQTLPLPLLAKVTEFNLYPIRYIHPSWLTKVAHARLIKRLRPHAASHYDLSQYLLASFQLATDVDYDFQAVDKRVALASGDVLAKLVLYVGLILHNEIIKAVIQQHERTALKDCIGESAYYFAVKKAPFINRTVEPVGPSILIDWQHIERFKAFLNASGLQVMAIAYQERSATFRRRLALKLPRQWGDYLMAYAPNGVPSASYAQVLIKAYKEVDPQWHHLFC